MDHIFDLGQAELSHSLPLKMNTNAGRKRESAVGEESRRASDDGRIWIQMSRVNGERRYSTQNLKHATIKQVRKSSNIGNGDIFRRRIQYGESIF